MRGQIDIADLHVKWREFLGIIKADLYQFQADMADGLLDLPEYADCTQSRQSGKSFILGLIIYFLAYYLKWDIIICAPKLDQTGRIMMIVSRVAYYMKRKKGVRHPIHSTTKIFIAERGSIICISGDPYADVEGHHAHLIVLDEKQRLQKDHISDKILPFRGFHNGLIWSLGIGGAPDSWGEKSREKAALPGNFLWKCPWPIVVRDKPNYLPIVEDQRELMLPSQFAAHYECEELDMSSQILIAAMKSYETLPAGDSEIVIGLDFGRIDKTIATVRYKIDGNYYLQGWLILDGDFAVQTRELKRWLKEDVTYDSIYGENNGVGRPVIDELNRDGLGIVPINVTSDMKTNLAQRMRTLATHSKLLYNSSHRYATMFYRDITNLTYKMTSIDNIRVEHSDFYSSAILTLMETQTIRISA